MNPKGLYRGGLHGHIEMVGGLIKDQHPRGDQHHPDLSLQGLIWEAEAACDARTRLREKGLRGNRLV